jgi:hypothetical protein
MDVDEAAARLYALLPEQFVAERTALAAAAKAEGDAAAAAEIRRLTKPSQPAWAVNRLVREHPGTVDELAAVASALRSAAEGGDPKEVRRVNAERQTVVSSLADRAGLLALEAGKPPTAATRREVESTLQAALSSSQAAEEVASGRLVSALFDTGLDALGMLSLAPAPPPAARTARPGAAGAAGRAQKGASSDADGSADDLERLARDGLEEAAGALARAEAEAGRTRALAEQADEEVAQLEARLGAVRRRAQIASSEADAAAARARTAGEEHERARRAYEALSEC